MSRPPIVPVQAPSGIALDPQSLERVIPETRRSDGTVRKQQKIRPGFTPQEDVRRFRGTRQAQMDTNAIPKGHIIGWVQPNTPAQPISKSAKKNAKRRGKREEQKKETVQDNWEDDEDEIDIPAEVTKPTVAPSTAGATPTAKNAGTIAPGPSASKPTPSPKPAAATKAASPQGRKPVAFGGSAILAKELAKLDINKR